MDARGTKLKGNGKTWPAELERYKGFNSKDAEEAEEAEVKSNSKDKGKT